MKEDYDGLEAAAGHESSATYLLIIRPMVNAQRSGTTVFLQPSKTQSIDSHQLTITHSHLVYYSSIGFEFNITCREFISAFGPSHDVV